MTLNEFAALCDYLIDASVRVEHWADMMDHYEATADESMKFYRVARAEYRTLRKVLETLTGHRVNAFKGEIYLDSKSWGMSPEIAYRHITE